ncbi:aspartic proteinase-like protein 2 [Pyrus ussuriensis x Pyrus communis]|uniref:Aspartic proteinase-like protein 2 n=1 Tax=Pyrus ussuriensis x Pyrus communis TaxID=2448454 RepID=A0A5N5FNA2_9ROSA|nr:aspartic proteinase-like protein 2 [Pyrus ussuriensis x Pyrus communis]
MNIDGSWNVGRRVAGFGAIIRDSDGLFVVALSGSFGDVSSPLLSKAMAVRVANAAAHHLAKVGLSLMQNCEWVGSPPSIVTYLLRNVCSSMLRDG